jgi:hypothetical protein
MCYVLTSYMHLLYLPTHLKDSIKKHWTVAPLHISNLQLCTSYLLIKLQEYQQLQITAMSVFTGSMWSATVRLPLIYQGSTNYKVKSCLLKLGTSLHHRVFNQNGRSNYLQMCLLTLLYLQSSFHIHPPSYWYIFHMHQQEAIDSLKYVYDAQNLVF